MNHKIKQFFSAAAIASLLVIGPTAAYAGEQDAFTGSVGLPYSLEIKNVSGDGSIAAMGINHTLVDQTIIVTDKPEDAKVGLYYDEAQLQEICRTGRATMTVTTDRPGLVTVQAMLVFEETTTHERKYLTGSFEIDFKAATDETETMIFIVNQTAAFNGNEMVLMASAPSASPNGQVMIPLRTFADIIDGQLTFDANTQTVTLTAGKCSIVYGIGQSKAAVNGDIRDIAAVATINEQGHTLVPVSSLAEAFGYDIESIYENDGTVVAARLIK